MTRLLELFLTAAFLACAFSQPTRSNTFSGSPGDVSSNDGFGGTGTAVNVNSGAFSKQEGNAAAGIFSGPAPFAGRLPFPGQGLNFPGSMGHPFGGPGFNGLYGAPQFGAGLPWYQNQGAPLGGQPGVPYGFPTGQFGQYGIGFPGTAGGQPITNTGGSNAAPTPAPVAGVDQSGSSVPLTSGSTALTHTGQLRSGFPPHPGLGMTLGSGPSSINFGQQPFFPGLGSFGTFPQPNPLIRGWPAQISGVQQRLVSTPTETPDVPVTPRPNSSVLGVSQPQPPPLSIMDSSSVFLGQSSAAGQPTVGQPRTVFTEASHELHVGESVSLPPFTVEAGGRQLGGLGHQIPFASFPIGQPRQGIPVPSLIPRQGTAEASQFQQEIAGSSFTRPFRTAGTDQPFQGVAGSRLMPGSLPFQGRPLGVGTATNFQTLAGRDQVNVQPSKIFDAIDRATENRFSATDPHDLTDLHEN